ncbi:MAG: uroporphyrinogen decarboxylase family protein [Rudaea sp.]
MTEWTCRRRVETSLAHREPDRVPIDLTITLLPYVRLREYLGLPQEENLKPSAFTEVRAGVDVLEALGIDITFVQLRKPANWSPPPSLPDGTSFDEWGIGRKRIELPGGGYLNEVSVYPLENATIDDLKDYPWPDPADPGRVAGLEEEARRLYEQTGLAIMGRFGGPILEQAHYLRGWERWLMDMAADPEFASALLDRITDIQISLDEAGLRAAGKYLSIFKLSGEDLGMQDRPIFSPRMWRELARPFLERRWRAARAALDRYAPHVKLLLHSDGAFRPFIPDLIECGVQALDPIQEHCPGMELYQLKRDFGQDLTFHGAVDTQQVLPFGTPAEVEAEVIRCIDALGRGGGYILAPVHNVQADVPPENLVAMCRAAQEYGLYPLPEREPLPQVHVSGPANAAE